MADDIVLNISLRRIQILFRNGFLTIAIRFILCVYVLR